MAESKKIVGKEVAGIALDAILDVHENVVQSVAWSPDGQWLVTSSYDALYIHNVIIGGSRQMLSNRRPFRSSYSSWSADGRLLAITDRKSIKLLNTDNLKLEMTFPDKRGYARTIQFSPDGSLLAATYVRDASSFVVVWDVRSGKEKIVLDKRPSHFVSIFWDEGGKLLGVINNDRIELYDITQWRRTRSLDFRKTLLPLAYSVVSGRYVAIPIGNTIDVYDLKKALHLSQLKGHANSINHICFSHDQRILASKSHDRTCKFWCCDRWELIASIDESANYDHVGIEICFSPNDQYFVSRTQNETAVRVWRVDIDALLSADRQENTIPLPYMEDQAITLGRAAFEAAIARVKANWREKGGAAAPPTCFISYAWGNDKHEQWVIRLARDLKNGGIDVVLDRWHNPPGASISKFVDRILKTDFILVVGTPLLKEKYEHVSVDAVVAEELLLINTRVRGCAEYGETVIPILLEGSAEASFTPFLRDVVYVDLRDKEYYFYHLFGLIARLYEIDLGNPHLMQLQDPLKPKIHSI